MKLPFGICQIGKAFRNEVVARQFVFRMREFEQMEMQFFCQPGTEMKWFEYWKKVRLAWHEALGMGNENYRYHDHEKLAHYANAATDIEFKMPFGFKEVEVSTAVPILTFLSTRSTAAVLSSTSIQRRTRAMYLTM